MNKLLITLTLVLHTGLGWSVMATAADLPAVFEARQSTVLSAERDGALARLKVKAGQAVKSGQVLALVDHGDLSLDLKRRRAQLKYLNLRSSNLEKLVQRGLATDEEVAKTRAERAVTISEIELLKRQIGRSNIKAPFSGKIVETLAKRHEWVQTGQPVVALLNPNKLKVNASVPAALLPHIKVGDKHQVRVPDLNNTVVEISLSAITPQVEVQSNTALVTWTVTKPPKSLLAGMKGVLHIDTTALSTLPQ